MAVKVLIVDDQRMFREGIRRRLEQEPDLDVIGEAASAEDALALIEQGRPNIVILDIRLPGMSGIQAARLFREQWPEIKILMLTGYDFDQYVKAAVRAGIDGYLLKDAPQEKLVEAIHDIVKGGAVLQPQVATHLMRSIAGARPATERREPDELTVREIEIVDLLSQGLRNSDIANRLSISVRTVEAHVSSIMAKLGASTRSEAISVAARRRLLG